MIIRRRHVLEKEIIKTYKKVLSPEKQGNPLTEDYKFVEGFIHTYDDKL